MHEFAHNELNLLQELQNLFEDPDGQLFYSPWRTDPRPSTVCCTGRTPSGMWPSSFAVLRCLVIRSNIGNISTEHTVRPLNRSGLRCARSRSIGSGDKVWNWLNECAKDARNANPLASYSP